MCFLHPPIEPYAHGHLSVGDGHSIYWETCGNPAGQPALVLHGGPGSGASPTARRYFDPSRHRIILFDQRGCGRSTPHAGALDADLTANTTHHLMDDIERLRAFLGVERWLVLGGSWGSTLALAYAQRHPEQVIAMALYAVAATTPEEIDWITCGVRRFFPQAWGRFQAGIPAIERSGDIVADYQRRLMHSDPVIHSRAARDWCDWETALVTLQPGNPPHPRWESHAFRLGFARLVTHYWSHKAWLEEGELLRHVGRLADVPAILIHGRMDLGSPLITAWRLAQAWRGSELILLERAGHDGRDPGMAEAIVGAIRRLSA